MERFLVYFWETECGQYVKIGYSQQNLRDRKQGIQNGCPMPISKAPSGVILCKDKQEMIRAEKAAQKQFKAYRTSGEWFRLTPEISAYIQEFTECGRDIFEADTEAQRKRMRELGYKRRNTPEYREAQRERMRERLKDPEVREAERERRNTPEYREAHRKSSRKYRLNNPKYREAERKRKSKPEYREAQRERQRERRKDPEVREAHRKYERERRKDPEYREARRKYQREYYQRKKQERQHISGQQLELALVSTA